MQISKDSSQEALDLVDISSPMIYLWIIQNVRPKPFQTENIWLKVSLIWFCDKDQASAKKILFLGGEN